MSLSLLALVTAAARKFFENKQNGELKMRKLPGKSDLRVSIMAAFRCANRALLHKHVKEVVYESATSLANRRMMADYRIDSNRNARRDSEQEKT